MRHVRNVSNIRLAASAVNGGDPNLDHRVFADFKRSVLDGRKLSQADAAKVLGVTQAKVSALRHYKLAGYSVERLMNLLTALDQDVEIVIRQKPRSRKSARIVVAAHDLPMALKPKATKRQRRSFTSARRRAVARLRKGLGLQWTPPASRDALHDRGQGSRRRGR